MGREQYSGLNIALASWISKSTVTRLVPRSEDRRQETVGDLFNPNSLALWGRRSPFRRKRVALSG